MLAEADAAARKRLYEAYASQHAGHAGDAASGLIYRRDIRPLLPPRGLGPVLDIGCGQGQLVACLLADGYEAAGIDISPEQVAIARAAGLDRVSQGDFAEALRARAGALAAVTATDLLEHLTKTEVLATFDLIAAALLPGGAFRRPGAQCGQPARRVYSARRLHA